MKKFPIIISDRNKYSYIKNQSKKNYRKVCNYKIKFNYCYRWRWIYVTNFKI